MKEVCEWVDGGAGANCGDCMASGDWRTWGDCMASGDCRTWGDCRDC
jgi:hypothetical protein